MYDPTELLDKEEEGSRISNVPKHVALRRKAPPPPSAYKDFVFPSEWAPPTLQHPADADLWKVGCEHFLKVLTKRERFKAVIVKKDKTALVQTRTSEDKAAMIWKKVLAMYPGETRHVYAKGVTVGRFTAQQAREAGCSKVWLRKHICTDKTWYHHKMVPVLEGVLDEGIQVRMHAQRMMIQTGLAERNRKQFLQHVWELGKMGVRVYGLTPRDFEILYEIWEEDPNKPMLKPAEDNLNRMEAINKAIFYDRPELKPGFEKWQYYD